MPFPFPPATPARSGVERVRDPSERRGDGAPWVSSVSERQTDTQSSYFFLVPVFPAAADPSRCRGEGSALGEMRPEPHPCGRYSTGGNTKHRPGSDAIKKATVDLLLFAPGATCSFCFCFRSCCA